MAARIREAVLAGPRLLARSPLAFVAWVLLRIAEQYATLAVLLAARLGGAVLGVGAVWAVLLALPFEAVLVAALLRAQLKPQAKAFAYLRLGRVEFNMAGLLVLAGLAGALIALPVSIAAAYVGFGLKLPLVAGSSLAIGSLAAALGLMRFAPAAAIVAEGGRVDLAAAWRASRGRYVLLLAVVVGAAAAERILGAAVTGAIAPPALSSWSALAAPLRFAGIAWRSLVGVAALTVMAGAVATVWRGRAEVHSGQTLS